LRFTRRRLARVADPRAAEPLLEILRETRVESAFVELDIVELSPAKALERLAPVLDAPRWQGRLNLLQLPFR
jgi:hypothetical protein